MAGENKETPLSRLHGLGSGEAGHVLQTRRTSTKEGNQEGTVQDLGGACSGAKRGRLVHDADLSDAQKKGPQAIREA